jgi:Zn-dependent metalloprotease
LSAQDLSQRAREELVVATDVPLAVPGRGVGVLGEGYELSIAQRGDSYSLEDLRRGSQRTSTVKQAERLPGKTVTSGSASDWESPHAVSVHAHLATLWDYFASTHQRFGWDGGGRGLLAVIHAEVRTPALPVALFDGQRLLLGAGTPPQLLPAGAALDVVAHEYGHALLRATAELAAEGESGAIDEGLANLWACLIEHAMTPAVANWTVGESIYRPLQGTAALSDLADPLRTAQSRLRSQQIVAIDSTPMPASLSLLERSVRRHNAGFVGHAGFLIAQRIGPVKTAAILYRTVTTYLHRYADADDLADGMSAAALDMYGSKDEAISAVRSAWQTVGVTGFLQ